MGRRGLRIWNHFDPPVGIQRVKTRLGVRGGKLTLHGGLYRPHGYPGQAYRQAGEKIELFSVNFIRSLDDRLR